MKQKEINEFIMLTDKNQDGVIQYEELLDILYPDESKKQPKEAKTQNAAEMKPSLEGEESSFEDIGGSDKYDDDSFDDF